MDSLSLLVSFAAHPVRDGALGRVVMVVVVP